MNGTRKNCRDEIFKPCCVVQSRYASPWYGIIESFHPTLPQVVKVRQIVDRHGRVIRCQKTVDLHVDWLNKAPMDIAIQVHCCTRDFKRWQKLTGRKREIKQQIRLYPIGY